MDYETAQATIAFVEKVKNDVNSLVAFASLNSLVCIEVMADDADICSRCLDDAVSDLFYKSLKEAQRAIQQYERNDYHAMVRELAPVRL